MARRHSEAIISRRWKGALIGERGHGALERRPVSPVRQVGIMASTVFTNGAVILLSHRLADDPAVVYRGAGLDVVWPRFLATFVTGAAFFGIGLIRFRAFLAKQQ